MWLKWSSVQHTNIYIANIYWELRTRDRISNTSQKVWSLGSEDTYWWKTDKHHPDFVAQGSSHGHQNKEYVLKNRERQKYIAMRRKNTFSMKRSRTGDVMWVTGKRGLRLTYWDCPVEPVRWHTTAWSSNKHRLACEPDHPFFPTFHRNRKLNRIPQNFMSSFILFIYI